MDQTKQAVVLIEGRPHFDFSAPEFIAPSAVVHPETRETLKFYTHFRRYDPKEMHDLNKAIQAKTTVANGITRVEPGNDERMLPFFDTHFLRASGLFAELKRDEDGNLILDDEGRAIGIEAAPKEQLAFLSDGIAGVHAKKSAVGEKFLVLHWQKEEPKGVSIGVVISSLASARNNVKAEIRTAYLNGSPFPTEVTVPLTFHFKKESPQDRIAYKRADEAREIYNDTAELLMPTNFGELERLFDSLIQSIDGGLIGDVACEEHNKAEWIREVPAWYKVATIRRLFRDSAAKN